MKFTNVIQKPTNDELLVVTEKRNWPAHCVGLVFLAICIVPFFTFCYLIGAVGANNVSNDYLNFMPLIEPVFSGKYDWTKFLFDSFIGTHCELIGILTHLAVAKFLGWNARAELYIGLGSAVLRTFLLCSLLTEATDGKWKYLLYGGIVALVFSLSQSSLFLYGETSFPIGFCTLGFTIALFGIVKHVDKPILATTVMLLGGVVSSLSWGNFLPCWLCLFLALLLFNYKQKLIYAACAGGTLASLALCAHVRMNDLRSATSAISLSSFCNWRFCLNLLGRPFCNDLGILLDPLRFSENMGRYSILSSVFSGTLLILNKQFGARSKASVVLIAYALLSCWLISTFRDVLAPWYTGVAIPLWIGLWSLSVSLLKYSKNFQFALKDRTKTLALILGIANIAIIGTIYVWTNRTYEDKQFFLRTRAPVSESTLRNYRTAPTYCEQFLFQWGDGKYRYLQQLAAPLEKYSLSSFSNEQQWSLQGDFELEKVQVIKDETAQPIFWTDSMHPIYSIQRPDRNDWRSYKHLNIAIPNHTEVTWKIDLPANVESANLITAVAIAPIYKNASTGITQFAISGEETGKCKDNHHSEPERLYMRSAIIHPGRWYPMEISLAKYKGKQLTLTFSSLTNKTSPVNFALFQYPHINLSLSKTKAQSPDFIAEPKVKPSNTDLSPYMVKETPNDLCFPNIASNFWNNQIFKELIVSGVARCRHDQVSSLLASKNGLNIPLKHYSHLQIEAQSSMPPQERRSIFIVFNYANGLSERFSLPLLPDGGMHKYNYAFKVLDSPDLQILDQIFFRPVTKSGEPLASTIKIKSVRLIHDKI